MNRTTRSKEWEKFFGQPVAVQPMIAMSVFKTIFDQYERNPRTLLIEVAPQILEQLRRN